VVFEVRIVSYLEGDGIFIPSGPSSAHEARSITPGTRLIMVEDNLEDC